MSEPGIFDDWPNPEERVLRWLRTHGPTTAWDIEMGPTSLSPLRAETVVRDLLQRRIVTLISEPGMSPDVWQAWPFVCVSLRR